MDKWQARSLTKGTKVRIGNEVHEVLVARPDGGLTLTNPTQGQEVTIPGLDRATVDRRSQILVGAEFLDRVSLEPEDERALNLRVADAQAEKACVEAAQRGEDLQWAMDLWGERLEGLGLDPEDADLVAQFDRVVGTFRALVG